MKLMLCLAYVAVLIVMGTATFVESIYGTPFAHCHIYDTWWFAALWMLLVMAGGVYIIIRSRERRIPVLLLHASFVVILAGALLTHLTGRDATIHLRQGQPQCIAVSEDKGERYMHHLDFAVELIDFQIVEDKGRVVDYKSTFRIGDDVGCVSMNNIYKHGALRFYQMGYDNDLRGSTLMINRDPYGIPVTYCGYAMLLFSFLAMCLKWRGTLKLWLSTIALTTAWCIYYFVLDGSWSQIPVLRHPLLIFHVVVVILAYALLFIQTLLSAWALFKAQRRIVSVLHPALCFLSVGIFLGAVWANISWGNYWSWDSKETWALITLMIYAVPVHRRSLPVFYSPRVFHVYMLFAFLAVLMTYLGVNYFLTGLHSYN